MPKNIKKDKKSKSGADLLASLDSSYLDIIAQAVEAKTSGSNVALYEVRKAHGKIKDDQLKKVLSNYDIGKIKRTKIFPRGSRSSPKVLIRSNNGLYLLKRRASQLSNLDKVSFSHQLQKYIYEQGFSLPELIDTKEGNSFVSYSNNGFVYEMFEYIKGNFYDKSITSTHQCGAALGDFHKLSKNFESIYNPPKGSYHDSNPVRQIMDDIPGTIIKIFPRISSKKYNKLESTVKYLRTSYDQSAFYVKRLGFDNLPNQVIHGDWHPGNIRFDGENLKSVLDYDSVRQGKSITDIANGLLQFSVVGGNPKLSKWPDYLDENRFAEFMQGYHSTVDEKVGKKQLKAIPFLMIEALVAESSIPIAATGKFAHVNGFDFLVMVERKVKWITHNSKKLSKLLRY